MLRRNWINKVLGIKWNKGGYSWSSSSGGILPPFSFAVCGGSVQIVSQRERLEKAEFNPGLQELIIPIFCRRGFLRGAGLQRPHPQPALHAWSPACELWYRALRRIHRDVYMFYVSSEGAAVISFNVGGALNAPGGTDLQLTAGCLLCSFIYFIAAL